MTRPALKPAIDSAPHPALDLRQSPRQEGLFSPVLGEGQRAFVGGVSLIQPSGAAQQIGASGMEQIVVVEFARVFQLIQ